jgi:3-oxoacyl-[acyl-carrier-protein] synthase II
MSESVTSSSRDAIRRRTRSDNPANIVGMGAITGYGWGKKHLWDGFLVGESAVKLVTGLDGYVDGGEAYLSLIADGGDRQDGTSRFMRAVRFAGREAVTDALERGWKPGPVVGLIHSIEAGDIETWSEFYQSGESKIRPKRWVNMMPSTPLAMFMKEFDFHGPTMSVSSMCATGNTAMIMAKSWLDTGIASDVIVLATDMCGVPQVLRPFSDLGAAVLDTPPFDACRPFQEGSRGFVGGECAVGMVLSPGPTGSYASLLGGAMTMDGFHPTSINPDLVELFRCFRLAIDTAGVDPEEVAYLNAHGPGTAICDAAEIRILDELFPAAHGIFSVKPLVGHCQSGTAAVEILATIYAFQTGYIPAPRQVAPGHPKLVNGRTPRVPGVMLKSSMGLGGYNTVTVLAEPEG